MSKIEPLVILITTTLIIHATLLSYGQNSCERNKIYGTWKTIGSVGGYQNVVGDVDSLKKIIHIHSDPGIYEFQADGTYTYDNPTLDSKKPYLKKDVFIFNEKTCQIVLGVKKKAHKNANLEVLYVDDDYMIITDDNNPHGDYTTLYSKQ